ncbi:hypothetical protein [uncultured Sphaerotilus sp.]|uniref:hypothetical protein n=1 Tax=uncultured Sphaerotilus sp. TaxID=474984 RepID=UPI0030CA40E6
MGACLWSVAAQAVGATEPPEWRPPHRWSVSWGWNRSVYTASDIHLHGADHDFTLSEVQAHDSQTPLTLNNVFHTFLNPGRITIPQTNLRLAYQLDAGTAIALNLDHMKYVVTEGQQVAITGSIAGTDRTGSQTLSPDFLKYEHTDGLNVLSLEGERQWPVDLFGAAWPTRAFGLAGLGIVVPKSNVTLGFAGQPRNDQFHVAGYSLHVGAGVETDLSERFFVRNTVKVGHVDLPDVWTSARHDKASQRFRYAEWLLAVGLRF